MADDSRFLVYGAYGYTGRLVVEEAAERGLDVVAAGRDEKRTRDVAEASDVPSRAFDLSEAASSLDGVSLVLNCAGPFDQTADEMVDACIETGTDYLDITGELPVFERLMRRSDDAEAAGVTLLPGVGFDVIPTDCLAAHLKSRLPDATHLTLALETDASLSPGTLKTALGGVTAGGAVRRDGDLRWVPVGHKTRAVDFGDGLHRAVTVPWGDVSTAYFTTGIPNVEVYLSLPSNARRVLRLSKYLGGVLDAKPVQSFLSRVVERYVDGPDEGTRASAEARVWGEVRSPKDRLVSRLRTPGPYQVTVETALLCAQKTLDGEAPTGYQTPAAAFGPDLVLDVPGVERVDLKDGDVVARESGPAVEADEPDAGRSEETDREDVELGADAVTVDVGDDHSAASAPDTDADGEPDDASSPRTLSDDATPAIRRREAVEGTTEGGTEAEE